MPALAGSSCSATALLPTLHALRGASWGHFTDLSADSRQHGRKGEPGEVSGSPLHQSFAYSRVELYHTQPHPWQPAPPGKVNRNQTWALWRPWTASKMGILGHHEESQWRSSKLESWDMYRKDTPGKKVSLCRFGAGWLQAHRELWVWGVP